MKIIYTIAEGQDTRLAEKATLSTTNKWTGEKARIDKAILTKHLGKAS
ncbi:MAG TPA: hypothetical protein VE619_05280 [Nitrososphaeraceae archaeon]|nr:hypothetical protein [Nitrososphaeraceae archaeon]